MNETIDAVSGICTQLVHACRQIGRLSEAISADPELAGLYRGMRMDELEHAQLLILKITELVTAEDAAPANGDGADGSAFAAGDLNAVKKAGEEEEE